MDINTRTLLKNKDQWGLSVHGIFQEWWILDSKIY